MGATLRKKQGATINLLLEPPKLYGANVKLLLGTQGGTPKGKTRPCQALAQLVVQPKSVPAQHWHWEYLRMAIFDQASLHSRGDVPAHQTRRLNRPASAAHGDARLIAPHKVVIGPISPVAGPPLPRELHGKKGRNARSLFADHC